MRVIHSGTVIDNRIYLVSGYGRPASQTTEYSDGERWIGGPHLPYEVDAGSCTVTTSPTTILVTGGGGTERPLNKVVELNITTGRWRHLASMRDARCYHGCTLVGRNLVVAGGWNGDRQGNMEKGWTTSEILDLDTEQWSRAGDMTKAVSYKHLTLPTKA